MEIEKLVNTLHPLERKILPLLEKTHAFDALLQKSGLKDVEVMRALQWLENKGLIRVKDNLHEQVILEENGKLYASKGLPEKRILEAIRDHSLSAQEILKKAQLSGEEFNGSLGALKGKAAIEIKKEDGLIIAITAHGKKLLEKGLPEEKLLQKKFPVDVKTLADEEKYALENLRKRKNILSLQIAKAKSASLTTLGRKAMEKGIDADVEERVTPEMLRSGTWKDKIFRRYDVTINVPRIYGGRKQFYRKFLDEIRSKFLSMGFTEMTGPVVEMDFWNMDALFMPQFHSARDIHDAYYIKEPIYGKLDENLVKRVKAAHEDGFGTGSKGWQYTFDANQTHRYLLRTHDTAISARTLASKDLKIPGKYFQTVRCFRPDLVDASHNVDFTQTGGIVVGDGLNFGHLKGLLRLFAEEFAQTSKIKIVPAYFPFTEPSAELHAKHPDLGWIELAGSGIFRPELVKPLVGREVPVIAWGVGVERLAMINLGIKDIRQLFSHDLSILRNTKMK